MLKNRDYKKYHKTSEDIDIHRGITIIAKDTNFEGNIVGGNDIYIFGTFNGSIKSRAEVTVEEGAKVKANLNAEELFINGQIEGNVEAKSKVHIGKTAHVEGDIKSRRIIMEPGAYFKGNVKVHK